LATNAKTRAIPPIVIEPHEWDELAVILRSYLPGRRVWAFGSRATGQRVRRFSDLDLAVDGGELTLSQLGTLHDVLDESRLPFKVDIVDLATVTPEFRARIQPDMVLVQGSR